MTILYFSAPNGLKSSNTEQDASAAAAQTTSRLRMARRGARRAAEDALGTKAANVIRRTQKVAQAERALIRSGLFTSVRVVAPPAPTAPAPITREACGVKARQFSSEASNRAP